MSLHAFDDVSDALDATRSFLFPFDRTKWLKLAVIVFFIGGFGAQFPSGFNYGTGSGDFDAGTPVGDLPPWVAENVWVIVGAVVALIALFVLLMALLSSVMQFVFIEALRGDDEVHIRAPFRTHFWKGVRLMLFQLGILLLILGPPGAFIGFAAYGMVTGTMTAAGAVPLFILGVTLLVLLALVFGLVANFTVGFVAPVMLLESRGVIAGWRRFWPTLRSEWKEYLAYVVMSWVLGVVVAIAVGVAAAIAFVVLAIPFGLVGGLTFLAGLSLGSTTAAAVVWWVLAFEVLLFAVAALVLTLLIAVPVQTFLRYYSLFVLGDTEEAFDVIPDRRAAVREADDDTAAAA